MNSLESNLQNRSIDQGYFFLCKIQKHLKTIDINKLFHGWHMITGTLRYRTTKITFFLHFEKSAMTWRLDFLPANIPSEYSASLYDSSNFGNLIFSSNSDLHYYN